MNNIESCVENINNIPAVRSILDVICGTTGMGFAAVARVTDHRWIACAVRDDIQFGLIPGGELKLETTICNEIRDHQKMVVIDHVDSDPLYANHHTPLMYGFQSYISVPIMLQNGQFFGTLCAIDPRPNQLSKKEITDMFSLFADLIAFHLSAVEQVTYSNNQLMEEREISELREQFIAILGHDLRNPVTAVSNVAQLMMRMPLDDRMKRLAVIIQDSTFRMRSLIDNILDFASGRLGDGIKLNYTIDEPLENTLLQIINELRIIWPDREIDVNICLTQPVYGDGKRIAQLFSNLLGNALTYGDPEYAVNVSVNCDDDTFTLSVTNKCDKIPEIIISKLFQPFTRGEVKNGQQGLGLGLYIASEIARAHNGKITIRSDDKHTSFTFTMPVK
ncbi:GAF domain-containing sensor histidine kinase [Mucilaginibacter sp. UR6-1]|uniref:GAF domain-containing sensor histidine kinase n=1 Tax=Mucilaginibacter sp. UR6-1 TaxID=1435643 RepID=UPI001E5797A9|nr:GAF domain-containing sensor histidine kinase [Mucilaginibacter sp. UR6-1]MCC8407879.1 GAF domain-containing sensor histidine kinase [Mucilaginibacter sp. UR6-1]